MLFKIIPIGIDIKDSFQENILIGNITITVNGMFMNASIE
jgi:hypothetical protein